MKPKLPKGYTFEELPVEALPFPQLPAASAEAADAAAGGAAAVPVSPTVSALGKRSRQPSMKFARDDPAYDAGARAQKKQKSEGKGKGKGTGLGKPKGPPAVGKAGSTGNLLPEPLIPLPDFVARDGTPIVGGPPGSSIWIEEMDKAIKPGNAAGAGGSGADGAAGKAKGGKSSKGSKGAAGGGVDKAAEEKRRKKEAKKKKKAAKLAAIQEQLKRIEMQKQASQAQAQAHMEAQARAQMEIQQKMQQEMEKVRREAEKARQQVAQFQQQQQQQQQQSYRREASSYLDDDDYQVSPEYKPRKRDRGAACGSRGRKPPAPAPVPSRSPRPSASGGPADMATKIRKERNLREGRLWKKCASIHGQIRQNKKSTAFQVPVDPVALGIPNYFDVIKSPMDLMTVNNRLEQQSYSHWNEFAVDMRLIFNNAITYNGPGHVVSSFATELIARFEKLWAGAELKIQEHVDKTAAEDAMLRAGGGRLPAAPPRQRAAPAAPPVSQAAYGAEHLAASGRQFEQMQAQQAAAATAAKSEPAQPMRDMTYDEKEQLTNSLGELDEDQIQEMVGIIQRHAALSGVGNDQEEIELDVDTLPAKVLWDLDAFVKSTKKAAAPVPVTEAEKAAAKLAETEAAIRQGQEKLGTLDSHINSIDGGGAAAAAAAAPPAGGSSEVAPASAPAPAAAAPPPAPAAPAAAPAVAAPAAAAPPQQQPADSSSSDDSSSSSDGDSSDSSDSDDGE